MASFESATRSFNEFLSKRGVNPELFGTRQTRATDGDMQEMIKAWIGRMTHAKAETLTKSLDGPLLPLYVVDCPKLHVVPKKCIEYQLRWCDKYAYEVLTTAYRSKILS